jgi:hypothetical protein
MAWLPADILYFVPPLFEMISMAVTPSFCTTKKAGKMYEYHLYRTLFPAVAFFHTKLLQVMYTYFYTVLSQVIYIDYWTSIYFIQKS